MLGIDTESRAATILGLAASLVLAVLVWIRPARAVLVLVVAFAALFAAGDGRELGHQLDDGRSGLAVAAAVLLVLHLVAAGLAAMMAAHRPRGAPAPPVAS